MSLHICDADYTPKPNSLTKKSANFNSEVKVAKINGPYFRGSVEFESFVTNILIGESGEGRRNESANWICQGKLDRDYIQAVGEDIKIQKDEKVKFGIFICSMRIEEREKKSLKTSCDQPVGFLLFQQFGEIGEDKTLYVHIDLLCHGKPNKELYTSGRAPMLIGAMEEYYKETYSKPNSFDRSQPFVQFSLEAADDGGNKLVNFYEERGFNRVDKNRLTYFTMGKDINPIMVKKYKLGTHRPSRVQASDINRLFDKLAAHAIGKKTFDYVLVLDLYRNELQEEAETLFNQTIKFAEYENLDKSAKDAVLRLHTIFKPRTRKALVGSGALPAFAGQGFAGFSNDKKYLVDKFGSKMIKEVIKKTKVLDRAAESASMRTGLSALRREVHGLKMQEKEKREHMKPSKLF